MTPNGTFSGIFSLFGGFSLNPVVAGGVLPQDFLVFELSTLLLFTDIINKEIRVCSIRRFRTQCSGLLVDDFILDIEFFEFVKTVQA